MKSFGSVNYRRSNQSKCLACWIFASWLAGGWRPTPVYVVMAISLILYPHNLWLSQVAGIFFLLLGLLRLTTLLRFISLAKLSCDETALPGFPGGPGGPADQADTDTVDDDDDLDRIVVAAGDNNSWVQLPPEQSLAEREELAPVSPWFPVIDLQLSTEFGTVL
ncbi:uncharacterized protein Dwil_GK19402 [Drosophila willistoni]|uniref:Uncharacterized protein n=1 Tax=Drosophila willistoni TaxID=7260 RepID=A0A0Q9WSM5_DROWI|nr:uncharacterized protein Dwil_GK19402 [Drosophila willistoni]